MKWVALILSFALALPSFAQAADPLKMGPYPVGVRTEVYVDNDRTCAVTEEPRTLTTEIWYPAVDGTNDQKPNKFSEFWVRPEGLAMGAFAIQQFGGNMAELDKKFKNVARRNAKIRDGQFPVLIFSHGNGGFRHQNVFQVEYLASHGYVVIAADHTGNSAISILPNRVLLYNKITRSTPERRDDRPKDVSFLVDQAEKLNKTEDHWLAGHLRPQDVGVLGHSFGGFTSCRVTELDSRLKAAMPMTLAYTAFDPSQDYPGCPVPLFVILAEIDRTVNDTGNARSTEYYEKAVGPKYLMNFKKAGHFTFTEMSQINPNWGDGLGVEKDDDGNVTLEFSDAFEAQKITNIYSVAFFDAYIKNDTAAKEFLKKNRHPEVVDYQHKTP